MAREMKDSGIAWIGQIPKEWEVCQFKRVHNGTNVGESIDKEYWSDNIKDIVFYTAGLNPINTTYKDFPTAKFTGVNDILLSRNGTPYVYLPKENAAYTDHIIRVSINEWCDRKFIRYAISQSISFEIVDTVSIATWSASLWNEQILPLPPLPEQHLIANFLDEKCGEIDELVALQEKMIEELKAYKQSVITETVTKGLDKNVKFKDSGVDWIGVIPEHWKIERIKNIVDKMEKGAGITKDEVFANGDTPCVRYGEIYSKYNYAFTSCCSLTKKAILNSLRYFNYGDLLCAGTGELVEEIGKTITYLGHDECLAGGDIIVIKHHQIPLFLSFALNCHWAQAQKSCNKAKLKVVHISASDIGNVIIAVPPLSEQHSIATYLDEKCSEIDSLISIKQKKIEALKDYKKSLIYEYVTGKKKVI